MARTLILDRRDFLTKLAALLPLQSLTGCVPIAQALCPHDTAVSDLSAPLTIDVHAHIFNGSDLQIKEFLAQTVVGREHAELYKFTRYMGGALQSLAWATAPTGQEELRVLDQYASLAATCDGPEPLHAKVREAYRDGYLRGAQALKATRKQAAGTDGAFVMGGTKGNVLEVAQMNAMIDALPDRYEDFEKLRSDTGGPSTLRSQPHLMGYLQFVLHHFNHRHANAFDYLAEYGRDSARKVDLLVASMVDYDYWLAQGLATRTTLEEQVSVMARISVVTGGRVHGFAPFCPLRELMTSQSKQDGEAMRLVKRAVQEQGFIGVKLYPPMGFAPWGNAKLGNLWSQRGNMLPPAARQAGFGEKLDGAMRKLFEWCLREDVPVMAHANASNGPNEAFEALAGADYWHDALKEFSGLRVSFGHFGDTDLDDHEGQRSMPYSHLMSSGDSPWGTKVYADSSYFAGVLTQREAVVSALSKLYGDSPNQLLVDRLMYGTDWTMILPQQYVDQYLKNFMLVVDDLEKRQHRPGLAQKFFAGNAVHFLGLGRHDANRKRLEAFYDRNKMDTPDWMKKLG